MAMGCWPDQLPLLSSSRDWGKISETWPPRLAAIKSIHFDDAQALSSPHYIGLIEAWLHDRGLESFKNKEFKTGDNRWLRAKFKLINAQVRNPEVKRFFLHRILAEHIDENGAKNTEHEILALEKSGASVEQLKPLKAALAQEQAVPNDHVAYTYKKVDGVDLKAHVYPAKKLAKSRTNPHRPLFGFMVAHGAPGIGVIAPCFVAVYKRKASS